MKFAYAKQLIAGLSLLACSSLFAAPLTVDVSGIQSHAGLRGGQNTVLTYDIGANSTITSVSYSVNLTAFSPSWLSEIGLAFTDSNVLDGVLLRPGVGVTNAGTGTYSDVVDLVAQGLSFAVGSDGILRLEFYESFDDFAGADGIWNFGTITFGIDTVESEVPEPASGLLLGAGLAMLGYAKRRRRHAAAAAH